MGLSDDSDASLFKKRSELCNKLCLDIKFVNEAWNSYESINKNYTLEGDPMHWLACAIYASCWKSGSGQISFPGNNVNFTSLLRYCNLSLAQFFFNIRQWSSMSNMPEEFTKKIENLEMTFAISSNLFKEYQPLFLKIFNAPEITYSEVRQHRSKKQKFILCTPAKVFEFCWIIFIVIKNDRTKYNSDLVTLCHLLIAVCDWAFRNAFLMDRRELLNPQFQGLPSNWFDINYELPKEAPCVISHLCATSDMITEVKYIKEYHLKKSIRELYEKQVLLTTSDSEGGDVFDTIVFERNFKNITQAYESDCLNGGEFDERVFLAEYKRKLLEKEQVQNNVSLQTTGDTPSGEFSRTMAGQECLTPLTGRKYLGPKEPHDVSAATTFSENIQRLNVMLNGRQPAPSENLIQLFALCEQNPLEKVKDIVQKLGEKFIAASGSDQTEANRKLQMATTLFYKLTENILQNEKSMHSDISRIVEKNVFYECMFACSLEIVVYCYSTHNSRKKVLWILDVLEVPSYNFVKVIELIIRLKDKLSRDIIKHLNMIEEKVLSSLVWKSDSLIWEAINSSAQEIPKFEETALPGHLQSAQKENSPLRTALDSESQSEEQSPGPSAADRFQSPVAHNSVVNRELFPSASSEQTFIQQTHLVIEDNGITRMIPIISSKNQKIQIQPAVTPKPSENVNTRPRRTGGLAILFRKFYSLAWERLEYLCAHLAITTTDMKRKIWTVFEELVRKNNCELMKNRDLDQLLMCAVYMICKLTKTNKSFADIMKSYRNQPQATSDIYRNVLISNKTVKVIDGRAVEVPEERGDLIKFYNNVIIQAMKMFAQKFVDRNDDPDRDKLLSPLPASRRQFVSPGFQVSENIIVKPLDSPTVGFVNGKGLNYIFSRSPSKNLEDINKAIKGNGVVGKRLLIEGEIDLPSSKRIANRKVQSLIQERRNQNSE